jgi:hypothetical protein
MGAGWLGPAQDMQNPQATALLAARGRAIQRVKAVSIGTQQLSHTTSTRELDAYPCTDQQRG